EIAAPAPGIETTERAIGAIRRRLAGDVGAPGDLAAGAVAERRREVPKARAVAVADDRLAGRREDQAAVLELDRERVRAEAPVRRSEAVEQLVHAAADREPAERDRPPMTRRPTREPLALEHG